jgi:putative membrane protein
MSLPPACARKERVVEDESSPETLARRLVYFAAERTLFAWVRTALGAMALGFVIDRFGLVLRGMAAEAGNTIYPKAFSFWAGTVLVAIGTLIALVASVRYTLFSLAYHRRNSTRPGHGILLGVAFTLLLAAVGAVIAAFLVATTD